MSDRNFSAGDVVSCVDAGEYRDWFGKSVGVSTGLRRGGLYTVDGPNEWGGRAHVFLREVQPRTEAYAGFRSSRFRLAFKPDPEVEREAVKTSEPHKQGEKA